MLEILINDKSLEVQSKPEHLSLYQLYLLLLSQQSDDSAKWVDIPHVHSYSVITGAAIAYMENLPKELFLSVADFVSKFIP